MDTRAKPAGMFLMALLCGILMGSILSPQIFVYAQSTATRGTSNPSEKISVLWWAKPTKRSENFSGLSTPVGVDTRIIPSFIDLDLVNDSNDLPKPLPQYDVLVIDDTSFPPGFSSFEGQLVVTIDGGISTLLYHLTGDTKEDEWWTFASIPSILWVGAMEKGTVESVSPSDDAMIYKRSLRSMSGHGIEIIGGPLAVDSSDQNQISVALFNVTIGRKNFLWLFLGPFDRGHPETPRRQTEIVIHFISVLLYSSRVEPSVKVRDISPSEFVLAGLEGTSPIVKMDLSLVVSTPAAKYLDKFSPSILARVGSGNVYESELNLLDGDLVTSLSIAVPIHPLESNPHEVNLSVSYTIGGEQFILHTDKFLLEPSYVWSDSSTLEVEVTPSGGRNTFIVEFNLPKPHLEAKVEEDRLIANLKYPIREYFPLIEDKSFELRVEDEETSEVIVSTEITFGEKLVPLDLDYGSRILKVSLYDGSEELQTLRVKAEIPLSPFMIGGALAVVAIVIAVIFVKLRRREEAEELERILEEGGRETPPTREVLSSEGEVQKQEPIAMKAGIEETEDSELVMPKKPSEGLMEEVGTEDSKKEIETYEGNLVLITPSGTSLLIDTTTTVKPGDLSVKGEGIIHFSKTTEGWIIEVEGVDAELNGEHLEENKSYRISDGDKLIAWGQEILIEII